MKKFNVIKHEIKLTKKKYKKKSAPQILFICKEEKKIETDKAKSLSQENIRFNSISSNSTSESFKGFFIDNYKNESGANSLINLLGKKTKKLNFFVSKPKTEILNEKNKEDSSINKPNENNKFKEGRWLEDEHCRFLEGIVLYGNDWKKIEKVVGTRSATQARSHAQKYFQKLKCYKSQILGIDFTLDTVMSLSDMINQIKAENIDQIISILNNISNKEIQSQKKQLENIEQTPTINLKENNPFNNNIFNVENFDIKININDTNEINQSEKYLNLENSILDKNNNLNNFTQEILSLEKNEHPTEIKKNNNNIKQEINEEIYDNEDSFEIFGNERKLRKRILSEDNIYNKEISFKEEDNKIYKFDENEYLLKINEF